MQAFLQTNWTFSAVIKHIFLPKSPKSQCCPLQDSVIWVVTQRFFRLFMFVEESCAANQMTDAWATSMKQLAITRMLRGIGSVLLDSNII